ncbi:MAG: 5-(carboxyamino)imidazole ribonucleotide mutase [Thermoplasmata archaeon]|nr:MAG: 5-(carboxyamino)imidazole ribonucleotide mutase [Thermoplasmata archaeon]RLF33810.1 MAG: 5-(carboxyamino)imidazole ribonucleotide mutase [Thermoplasmata archaeon]RLF41473.1 MAG: 5-(carboxyamino)imidazole ribonucleotide mutase [Thermoplasmata archaeon]HDN50513.1 5-(carboxyamino)imidazole ribonucleotide mutase [Thermoplasmatales archaeon]
MKVAVVMGSKSDEHVGKKATDILDRFDIPYEVVYASAHRTPEKIKEIAGSDADVFIAIAGLAAALPGSIASHTTKPVIGVPVSGKVNLDAILSIVQMPPGIPVAAVGLDRGDNAAILAAEILSVGNSEIAQKLEEYRKKMREKYV